MKDIDEGQVDSPAEIERALDEADNQAASTTVRYTHEEVFGSIRGELTNAG